MIAPAVDVTSSKPAEIASSGLLVDAPCVNEAAVIVSVSPVPTLAFTYGAHYCAIPREVNPEIPDWLSLTSI